MIARIETGIVERLSRSGGQFVLMTTELVNSSYYQRSVCKSEDILARERT